MILKVPLDLKRDFLHDPENFIRDIACVPVDSVSSFFRRKDLISSAFDYKRINPFDSKTLQFLPDFKCENPASPRYMHIDLALKKDAVGISMCHAPRFMSTKKTTKDGYEEVKVPYVYFDFIGRITAEKDNEIILNDIEDVIYKLTSLGFHLRLITFDRFQSAGTIQSLKSKGYICTILSVDHTSYKIVIDKKKKDDGFTRRVTTDREYCAAAQELKDSIYRGGINLPWSPILEDEIKSLEYDVKTNKVMKRKGKTDDLFQSVAGSCFNLVTNSHYARADTPDEIAARADKFDYQFERGDGIEMPGDIIPGFTKLDSIDDDFYDFYDYNYGR